MRAKTTLAAIATLAALGLAASASAAPASSSSFDPDAVSVRVTIADLDISTIAGAEVVLQRIRGAAKAICGDEPDIRLLDRGAQYHACMKVTVDRAVASLDNPLVTALNAGHGQSATILAEQR